MRRSRKRGPITFRQKAVLLSGFLSLIVLAFVGMCYGNIYEKCLSNANNLLEQTSQQISSEVNSMIKTLDSFTVAQYSAKEIDEIISEPLLSERKNKLQKLKEDGLEYSSEYKALRNIAADMISSYFFVDAENYYIFPFSYVNNRPEESVAVYRQSVNTTMSSPILFPPTLANSYFFYVRNVYNLPTSKTPGSIVQCVSTREMMSIVGNAAAGVDVYITDENGIVYAAKDWRDVGSVHPLAETTNWKSDRGAGVSDTGAGQLILAQATAMNRLVVLCLCDKDVIRAQTLRQMYPFIGIAALFIIALNVSIWTVATNIVRVINQLLKRIWQMQDGDYAVRMPAYRDSDFQTISDGFNSMAEKIQYMITVVHKEEMLRKESELKFLQAQINPHFLFNVLTNIRLHARKNGDDLVYRMLYSLGELIHAGIVRDDCSLISLEEELHYIEQYLYLQQIRFEDRLTFSIQVQDRSLLRCGIPRLCLESIVENGVSHGLEPKIGRGSLQVNVFALEEDVGIVIEDDGVGFDVAQVFDEEPGAVHSGIGLNNANQRLKLLFGESYGLKIESQIGRGTCIRVRVPRMEVNT